MLRLPSFTYYRPKTVNEAVKIAGDHGPDAMYVAGNKVTEMGPANYDGRLNWRRS